MKNALTLFKIRAKFFALSLVAIATRPIAHMFYTKLCMFDSDPTEVTKALGRITDQVREAGEKAIAEAKKGIAASNEQKERIDGLLLKQGELQAQVLELEQKAARQTGAEQDNSHKSIGYRAIENAEFKAKAERMASGERGSNRFEAKALTTVSSGASIVADRQAGVIMLPERPMTVRDLITPGRTSSNSVSYMKQTGFTNSAAPTAEGTRKPESTLVMALSTANVVKLAHFMKASTEILADFPALQSMIDGQLVYGLNYVEELQLLKGSGAAGNLNGIYTQASAFTAPFTVAGATNIDTLRLALLQSELALLPSTGIVLNPTNWAAIELLKDTQGRYLIGNPQGTLNPTLWNRPVVTTLAMTVNTFLTGAFKAGAQVFDREQSGIIVATENEDDWVNNLIAIMAEERLALAVYKPEAFIKGALTAP
jgi:HK97 family phage major capsid protein